MSRDLTMLRALSSGIEIHQVRLYLFCFWKELQYTQNKGIAFRKAFWFNGNKQTCVLLRNSHSLRTVSTFVTVHTFCASRDTRVSYGWCLLIQGYFCAL